MVYGCDDTFVESRV